MGSGKAALGLAVATRLKRAHRSPTSPRCSASVLLSAARRALSIIAYCCTGSHNRLATSTGSSTGPGRRWVTSGDLPGWSASTGSPPLRATSLAQRFASPPTTTATSEAPDAMAVRASLIRLCWGMPNSARWVRARDAPTPTATRCPGSGYDQLPWGTATRSTRSKILGDPVSEPAATSAWVISSAASACPEAAPTPTTTGVRRSIEPMPLPSFINARWHHRPVRAPPSAPADWCDAPASSVRPGARSPAPPPDQVPRCGRVRARRSGPGGDGLPCAGTTLASCPGERRRHGALVTVGHQMGPAVVDRSQSRRLPPVVEIDRHGRRVASGLKGPVRPRRRRSPPVGRPTPTPACRR